MWLIVIIFAYPNSVANRGPYTLNYLHLQRALLTKTFKVYQKPCLLNNKKEKAHVFVAWLTK